MKDIQTSVLLDTDIQNLMLHSDNVAFVQSENSLEHALLVLIKSGYSSIPVLDAQSRVQGIVSKTLILDSILGLERIEFERLSEQTVQAVMNRKVPRIKSTDTFFRALELSINQPYLCVEDEQGSFLGLLTRRAILALVYRYFRELRKPSQKE